MTLHTLVARIAAQADAVPVHTKIRENLAELWPRHAALIKQAGDGGSREGTGASALFSAAVLTAAASDRPWIGSAIAIQAAVHHLLADVEHPLKQSAEECLAFCASEIGGNRPRAIETSLIANASGSDFRLNGSKRWATLGPMATHLVVIASIGADEERNHLKAVVIPADRIGVSVEEMTIPGSVPTSLRLPHSLIYLDNVEVRENEVLEGDGYSHFLKPYRTIEDAFGASTAAAMLLALGFRCGAQAEELDELVMLVGSLRSAVLEGLSTPASHLVVNAAERRLPRLAHQLTPKFPAEIASWWASDESVPVAPTAKAMRAERALERLRSGTS